MNGKEIWITLRVNISTNKYELFINNERAVTTYNRDASKI